MEICVSVILRFCSCFHPWLSPTLSKTFVLRSLRGISLRLIPRCKLTALQHGADPEYLEALSWTAREELAANQLDKADAAAKETETLAQKLLQKRSLDAEPHLPVALGAALEVQAEVLAAHGQNAQAAALLRHALVSYGSTSISPRLHKNLNQLTLTSQPAPALSYFGVSRFTPDSA